MDRRGFIGAILAAGAAPAIVKAANIMPVFVRRESGLLAPADIHFTMNDMSLDEFMEQYLSPFFISIGYIHRIADKVDADILMSLRNGR